MNILITICARGGSKGILGKNIKNINGKPLIFYTIEMANQFKNSIKHNVDIILSTDSKDIKEVVLGLKLPINTSYKRPSYLATDSAGKIETINDVKNYIEKENDIMYDYVLDLDVTSPLRTVEDLKNALELIEGNKQAYNIFSVNKANRNPYFNMVEENKNGFFNLVKEGEFFSRQTAPKVYDLNASFYFYRNTFFENNCKSAITTKSLIYELDHICFDLDHPIDFDFMEYLLVNNKLDFKFL